MNKTFQQLLDPKTGTWTQGIPLPFYTTKGLPFWKRFNEKNWLPQCVFCRAQPIFKTEAEYREHYKAEHLPEASK